MTHVSHERVFLGVKNRAFCVNNEKVIERYCMNIGRLNKHDNNERDGHIS